MSTEEAARQRPYGSSDEVGVRGAHDAHRAAIHECLKRRRGGSMLRIIEIVPGNGVEDSSGTT